MTPTREKTKWRVIRRPLDDNHRIREIIVYALDQNDAIREAQLCCEDVYDCTWEARPATDQLPFRDVWMPT